MSDSLLRQRVIDALYFDPSVDADGIGVVAENGVVTLTGHVPSYQQKFAVERIAWSIRGVKAIAEELEVRLPSDRKLHDDEIARRALNIIAWNDSIPADAVRVKVDHGVITLSGEVPWHFQRIAAEYAVRKLSGVAGIVNDIRLAPKVDPGDVRRRIIDALERHARVEAARVNVTVRDGGEVVLEGEVDDWPSRQAVERAAWSAAGVRRVDDRVRIA